MSKANPARQLTRALAKRSSGNQGASPSCYKPCASTQGLILRIWETLNWPKTLQMAFLVVAGGCVAALLLVGLEIAAHAMSSQTAAWPVSITVTATVSFKAARRRRR
jgi:hypothetical protein